MSLRAPTQGGTWQSDRYETQIIQRDSHVPFGKLPSGSEPLRVEDRTPRNDSWVLHKNDFTFALKNVYYVPIMKKVWHYIKTTLAIAIGLWVVLKQMFRKPVTIQFPEQRVPMYPRYRGLHFLERYEDGSERCVCCGLCAAACPADCIYMEPAENEKGERYAQIYEINELRCIFCGFCEEACPEEAIFLGKEYEFAADHRDKFIYTKADLFVPWPRVKPSPINFIRKERRHYAEGAPSLH